MTLLFCAAEKVLGEYREKFINHMEAEVVASDLRFKGIIPQGCHAQISQTFDRIQRNEILHDRMMTSCTREALIVACNIFIAKEGYTKMKDLGVEMKKSLEQVCTCVCVYTYMCAFMCVHMCTNVFACICVNAFMCVLTRL